MNYSEIIFVFLLDFEIVIIQHVRWVQIIGSALRNHVVLIGGCSGDHLRLRSWILLLLLSGVVAMKLHWRWMRNLVIDILLLAWLIKRGCDRGCSTEVGRALLSHFFGGFTLLEQSLLLFTRYTTSIITAAAPLIPTTTIIRLRNTPEV